MEVELPEQFYTENFLSKLFLFAKKTGFKLEKDKLTKGELTYILRPQKKSFHMWDTGGAGIYRLEIFKEKIDYKTKILKLEDYFIYESYNQDSCDNSLFKRRTLWFDENEELLKIFFQQKSETLTNS